jgi:hypothetical protein
MIESGEKMGVGVDHRACHLSLVDLQDFVDKHTKDYCARIQVDSMYPRNLVVPSRV